MSVRRLKDYKGIVGEEQLQEIDALGSKLSEKTMVHVNATFYGGGVAEMLNSYIPLLTQAGLRTEWRLLKGGREFFSVTKKMHNALQGADIKLTKKDVEVYESTLETNAHIINLNWYDCVVIDDPQPCGLISLYTRDSPSIWKPLPDFLKLLSIQATQPWVWRLHIDLSKPNSAVWRYLRKFMHRYEAVVVSHGDFAKGVKKPTFIIPPAIDPLSEKNTELSERKIDRLLSKNGIDPSIPIIAQVSRFDPWKDPIGVIKAFHKARKNHKCQLVLMGSMAADDPEGEKIFNQVFKVAEQHRDVSLITLQSDLLVNALQRKAAVVLQKSIREGFGLTVSEAMWKGTPVIGSDVGGIPLQIDNGKNGFLVSSVDEAAQRIAYLLENPKKAFEMGANGREKVRQNFLITRLVLDELKMCKQVLSRSAAGALKKAPKQLFDKLLLSGKLLPKGIEKLVKS